MVFGGVHDGNGHLFRRDAPGDLGGHPPRTGSHHAGVRVRDFLGRPAVGVGGLAEARCGETRLDDDDLDAEPGYLLAQGVG